MRSGRGIAALVILLLSLGSPAPGQQPDAQYRFDNRRPAYPPSRGPIVCIDEGHANLHTLGGTYAPFAKLLQEDGYRPEPLTSLTAETLARCGVVVISNARAKVNVGDRGLPHPPAFDKAETDALAARLTSGGAVLLIADHAPFPGAVADIGLLLGVNMLDAFAVASRESGVITVFGSRGVPAALIPEVRANPGSLGDHPILRGRGTDEQVAWVVTFTGHAFYPSNRVEPLLVFGPNAVAGLDRPDAGQFPIGGWLQAGAVRLGKGRAVILGEATMCTAQVGGPRRVTTGMNSSIAPHNARFCLNAMHWLTGFIDPGTPDGRRPLPEFSER